MGRSRAKEIIEERRRKVSDLAFVKGMSQYEIACQLGWSPRTIWDDIQVLERRSAEETRRGKWESHIVGFKARNTKRRIESWKDYDTLSPLDKIKARRDMREEDVHEIEILERMGVLPKAVNRNENINFNVGIKKSEIISVISEIDTKQKKERGIAVANG